jgi:hypothetical protein
VWLVAMFPNCFLLYWFPRAIERHLTKKMCSMIRQVWEMHCLLRRDRFFIASLRKVLSALKLSQGPGI